MVILLLSNVVKSMIFPSSLLLPSLSLSLALLAVAAVGGCCGAAPLEVAVAAVAGRGKINWLLWLKL